MATSAVGICNLALTRLGISRSITSLSENSTEAKLCNRVYDQARDQLLSEAPWPWAMKYATLALLDESDTTADLSSQPWRYEWKYIYQVPIDAINCNRLVVDGGRGGTTRPVFRLFQGSSGPILATDEEDAVLEYVSKVTDEQKFPPAFVSALAWKVAYEISLAMSAKQSIQQMAFQAYQIDLSKALRASYSQEQPDAIPDSEYIEGR